MADLPPPPPPPYDAAVPLTSEASLDPRLVPGQLAAAEAAWRPIGRAAAYARFDAASLAVFAVLSALPCLGSGWAGYLLAAALGTVAYVEFAAVRQLRRLDLAAPRRLAMNQLALGGGLVLYAGWNLFLTATDRGGLMAELRDNPSLVGDNGPQVAQLLRTSVYALYGSLAVLGVLAPGATAWFYASRSSRLRAYLADTPDWILRMQRDRGTLASGL